MAGHTKYVIHFNPNRKNKCFESTFIGILCFKILITEMGLKLIVTLQ